MKLLLATATAALVAALPATAASQEQEKLRKSETVVNFFTGSNHGWMIARNQRYCTAVPWLATCTIARAKLKWHKGRVAKLRDYLKSRDARYWADSWAARCVSSKEGGVASNTGNGYYGKWQADIDFQRAYGREFYDRWGVASNWPAWAQDVMAHRGYRSRGWQPWPTTSVMCGLR